MNRALNAIGRVESDDPLLDEPDQERGSEQTAIQLVLATQIRLSRRRGHVRPAECAGQSYRMPRPLSMRLRRAAHGKAARLTVPFEGVQQPLPQAYPGPPSGRLPEGL